MPKGGNNAARGGNAVGNNNRGKIKEGRLVKDREAIAEQRVAALLALPTAFCKNVHISKLLSIAGITCYYWMNDKKMMIRSRLCPLNM